MNSEPFAFSAVAPPVLTEALLRQKLEKRRQRRQAVLLALAMLLSQSAAAFLGWLALGWEPWLAALCFTYVCLSASGGAILTVLSTGRKDGLRCVL